VYEQSSITSSLIGTKAKAKDLSEQGKTALLYKNSQFGPPSDQKIKHSTNKREASALLFLYRVQAG
jgi:hypothetical protein